MNNDQDGFDEFVLTVIYLPTRFCEAKMKCPKIDPSLVTRSAPDALFGISDTYRESEGFLLTGSNSSCPNAYVT
jgi:hypothetical protein